MRNTIRSKIILSLLAFALPGMFPFPAKAAGVDYSKLPLPTGAKKIFVDSNSGIYSVSTPAGVAAEACEKLLLG